MIMQFQSKITRREPITGFKGILICSCKKGVLELNNIYTKKGLQGVEGICKTCKSLYFKGSLEEVISFLQKEKQITEEELD